MYKPTFFLIGHLKTLQNIYDESLSIIVFIGLHVHQNVPSQVYLVLLKC